jgi:hypothetical protein
MRRRPQAAVLKPTPQNALLLAAYSAANFGALMLNLMYGTPERTRLTLVFCAALLMLGYSMSAGDSQAMAVCPV